MKKFTLAILSILFLNGCAEEKPTFSILPELDVFYQSPGKLNNKIDILWVIDNSSSMNDEQINLANNFNSFITGFIDKGYDFKLAVTTTDAWRAPFINQPNLAKFRDGRDQTSHTGVFVITPETPNLISTFVTNVAQGTLGYTDERAFHSFKMALSSNLNADFVRPDGFLSIIIVSDEDDFSNDTDANLGHNYSNPAMHPISHYTDFLDGLTQSTGALRRYSVSSISIKDATCLQATQGTGGIMGLRYMDLAAQTDGVVGDICAPSYAPVLDQIQNKIAELSTQFFLSRVPLISTLAVRVNGTLMNKNTINGWTFNPLANSIVFHGTAIPKQGAAITVDYDPAEIK